MMLMMKKIDVLITVIPVVPMVIMSIIFGCFAYSVLIGYILFLLVVGILVYSIYGVIKRKRARYIIAGIGLLRFLLLGAILYLLFRFGRIDPLALVIGVVMSSAVVILVLIRRLIRFPKEA
ncbi:MAG: hypothetical protein DRH51_04870 [Candidatus Coatesbacteria bacterium]|nr:MAG: hypothetical protein DRH51_04870 [Candidatus Coatesbacteria bacterium]RLC42140.1 MAG: hypothetical protein DRH49_04265 [Candidatus Coatesbacteria bacterium]RLC43843.1 MAG: hypothetical protein DRH44_04205 [Candidatus Coatesbacteria bacterium]